MVNSGFWGYPKTRVFDVLTRDFSKIPTFGASLAKKVGFFGVLGSKGGYKVVKNPVLASFGHSKSLGSYLWGGGSLDLES